MLSSYYIIMLVVPHLGEPTPHFISIPSSPPCRAVIRLLPRLAAFAPERFAQDYLHKCIAHLLAVLKHTGERGSSFAALADMASSLAAVGCQDGFEPYLPAIAAQVCLAGFVSKSGCLCRYV
jgi:FKBP12-rapamycin complex-associated protein